jgi:excisionase family DNA binding protein
MEGKANSRERPRTLGQDKSESPWTVQRAAGFLGVSPQTVYLWVERRSIPHFRIMGRNIRFLRSDLEVFRTLPLVRHFPLIGFPQNSPHAQSLMPQRNQRIHLRRPTRRHQASEQRHARQEAGDRKVGKRIRRFHAKQQRLEKSGHHQRPGKSSNHTDGYHQRPFAHREAQDVAPLRAHGDADADFVRASAKGVRHHAVDGVPFGWASTHSCNFSNCGVDQAWCANRRER